MMNIALTVVLDETTVGQRGGLGSARYRVVDQNGIEYFVSVNRFACEAFIKGFRLAASLK